MGENGSDPPSSPPNADKAQSGGEETLQTVSQIETGTNQGANNENDSAAPSSTPANPSVRNNRQAYSTMYGRASQQTRLYEAFENCLKSDDNKSKTLICISGAPGTGKTLLAQTLRKPVREMGGILVAGKFDQLRLPIPYGAFVSAFEELVNVLQRDETDMAKLRQAVQDAVGNETTLLMQMIPPLSKLVGKGAATTSGNASSLSPANETTPMRVRGDEGFHRFCVLRNFLRVVCSPEAPLVLLLDDVHWADACSLDLLLNMMSDTENMGFVVVTTYNDSLGDESLFASKLRRWQDSQQLNVFDIGVGALGEEAVIQIISDALHLSGEDAIGLGTTVMTHTGGTPAFIIEFLWWLEVESLLYFDKDARAWWWDSQEIENAVKARQVDDYLKDELKHLTLDMKQVLSASAALGSHVDLHLLEYILGVPVGAIMEEAVMRGIVVPDHARGGYNFEYDRMQEAVYSLITESERDKLHLELGRRIWRQLKPDELDRYIYVVLSQLRIGRSLITEKEEQTAVATLCLHAGVMAARTSAFNTAWTYLEFGIGLLREDRWDDNYDLAFALYNAASEMAMCTTNYEQMDTLIQNTLEHAKSLPDQTRAYATKVYSFGARERHSDAIEVGIEIMKKLGERLPSQPRMIHITTEMATVKRQLRGKSPEQLMRIPPIEDSDKLACLKVLHLVVLNSFLARPQFAVLATLRMVKITLRYGLSVFSPFAFSCYAGCCIALREDIDSGFCYGELSLKLLQRFNSKEHLPRVYGWVYGAIHHWRRPLKDALNPLMVGYKTGLETGDIEGACGNAVGYILVAMDMGTRLGDIDREWKGMEQTMATYGMKTMRNHCLPGILACLHYMGVSEDLFSTEKGELLTDEGSTFFSIQQTEVEHISMGMHAEGMVVAYMFNDYDLAADKAKALLNHKRIRPPPFFKTTTVRFFLGLVGVACARKGRSVRRNIAGVRWLIRDLRRKARLCPQNCSDKLFMLQAELASLRGKNHRAFEKYTCALAMAKASNFLHLIALYNERTARHFVGLGQMQDAKPYFEEACRYYIDWGGIAKANQLKADVDNLYSTTHQVNGVNQTPERMSVMQRLRRRHRPVEQAH